MIIREKDENGNVIIQYPATRKELVIGLSDALDTLGSDIEVLKAYHSQAYGVVFEGESPSGVRLGKAVGMRTAVGVDNEVVENEFDKVYPWNSIRRCNGYFDEDGEFIVTAYKGEPEYATDGSNGNVFVEYPKFWIAESVRPSAAATEDTPAIPNKEAYFISPVEVEGYRLPNKFIKLDGTIRDYVYIPAYEAGEVDGKPVSIAGVDCSQPKWSYTRFLTACQTELGEGWSGTTMEDFEIWKFLFLIEFATRDSQSIMRGVCDLSNTAATVSEVTANTNYVIVPNTTTQFYEGCPIKLHETANNGDGEYHDVTAIEPYYEAAAETYDSATTYYTRSASEPYIYTEYVYDETTWATDWQTLYVTTKNKLIFEADADVTVTATTKVYCCPFKTGYSDGIVASSGCYKANNGKFPMMYRGIENLWGNTFTIMFGVMVNKRQAYILKDASHSPTAGTAAAIEAAGMTALSYVNGTSNGYASEFGYDEENPTYRFPIAVEGSDSTYWCDRYYQSAGVYTVRFGGYYSNGSNAGLFSFSCSSAVTYSAVNHSSRLSYTG